jgi:hypothetical protein
MLGRNNSNMMRQKRTTSAKDVLNVATIISSAVVCIKLALWGVFEAETAVLVMVGVVVLVALGNVFAKLSLALLAVYFLLKSQAGFSQEALISAATPMIALLIVLIGIYVMVKSLFK